MYKLAIVISALALVGFPTTLSAQTCSGKWNGKTSTSVEFKLGGKIEYCFAKDCWTSKVYQNGKDFLFVVGGNSGASVEMKAAGKGYNATWQNGKNSAKAKLTCQ
ncbi:MAG: hypothetical protein K8F59_17080 [Rhodobacteraceae bacterium]|nr:hypothetical protein [Paracoccaceae bacterium]